MFGMKEHMYVEGVEQHGKLGNFLKSFKPLIWIIAKGPMTCGDEEIGTVYKVKCSDKMAKTIEHYFGWDTGTKWYKNVGHDQDGNVFDIKTKAD